MYEKPGRSFIKSLAWRPLAILNSWAILALHYTENPFWNAIIMNVTGTFLYYAYERVCDKTGWGRS
tara:strand:+ start:800 stop:997 length:198 start_codon:yes stop_codon:yes gene_type:complete